MIRLLFVVSIVLASPAIACKYDADCDIGEKCTMQSGQTDGSCISTRQPGNATDAGLSRDPTNPATRGGYSCSVDADCGAFSKCLRTTGHVIGTCASSGGINVSH